MVKKTTTRLYLIRKTKDKTLGGIYK